MLKRGSGILLHVTSLPSQYGIGDFGDAAGRFIEFLHLARQRYWQILPLNPTDPAYDNSPYSSDSAFAINPLLTSPDRLAAAGWVSTEDLREGASLPAGHVDYHAVAEWKQSLYRKAYESFCQKGKAVKNDFAEFCRTQADWLDDYALFRLIKSQQQKREWPSWPAPLRDRDSEALQELSQAHADRLEEIKFVQFCLRTQWDDLRRACRKAGVSLIGDIPIYVNADSADVWANRGEFQLDVRGRPRVVAGVPPDYFSKTGQRWGNPLYRWDAAAKDGFRWWVRRLRYNLDLFDWVRIDHFRGLIAYWQVDAKEETAVNGRWVTGPGDALFQQWRREFGGLPIIAEDLGIITKDVTAAMDRFGFPGMKVLMFAFGEDLKTHTYLPHNYPENCVAYTGTHDNNTIHGWLKDDISKHELVNLKEYFGEPWTEQDIHWRMMRKIMESRAAVTIVPMPDLLGFDGGARMNRPGTNKGNWTWRVPDNGLSGDLARSFGKLAEETRRA